MNTNKEQIKKSEYYLIHYMTIRKAIGILCISLPAILIIGNYFIGNCSQLEDSISEYYYTVMGDIFVGIISSISLFLVLYKSFDRKENIATNLAGIFILVVAFFPVSSDESVCAIRHLDNNIFRIYFHYFSAFMFSLIFAYISFFLFTKSLRKKTKQKIIRNKIYKVCGTLILFSTIAIFLLIIIPFDKIFFLKFKPILWFEWLALLSFGVSWLVKGGFLFKDKVKIIYTDEIMPNNKVS